MARTVAYASFQFLLANLCLSLLSISYGVELTTGLQMFSVLSYKESVLLWKRCGMNGLGITSLKTPIASNKSELKKEVAWGVSGIESSPLEISTHFLGAKAFFCWVDYPSRKNSEEEEILAPLSGIFSSEAL